MYTVLLNEFVLSEFRDILITLADQLMATVQLILECATWPFQSVYAMPYHTPGLNSTVKNLP